MDVDASEHTLAERNYDIRNQELLGVKLAFEEWRHLLEGHPTKLPTASQTAELLMQHVFRIHSIPQGMAYVRGSQFTSLF